MADIIPVVAACVMKDPDKILLHQKFEGQDEEGIPRNPELVGKWELPGGMMKYGETPEKALARELREEEGLGIAVYDILDAKTCIYTDKQHYLVLFYICLVTKGLPTHGKFLSSNELKGLDCLPGNAEIARKALKLYFG